MLNFFRINRIIFYYGFWILSLISAIYFGYVMFFDISNTTLPKLYTNLMMIFYTALLAIMIEERPKQTEAQKRALKEHQATAFRIIIAITCVNIFIIILACFISPAGS